MTKLIIIGIIKDVLEWQHANLNFLTATPVAFGRIIDQNRSLVVSDTAKLKRAGTFLCQLPS
jgi:hypothetical protein